MRIFYLLLFTLFLSLTCQHVKAEKLDLQTMIDHAKGDELILHEGEYKANIIIQHPIKITAVGNVVLKPANPKEPVITIEKTKQVSIEGLQFEGNNKAIQIKDAQSVYLSNLSIQKVNSGIELYRAKNIEIKNTNIIGTKKHYANKGNGISIFNSRHCFVEGNYINKMQDGVYVEEGSNITVHNNEVKNGRYGTHFMYSQKVIAKDNTYTKNVTGLMVMMTKNIKLLKNNVSYQEGFNGTGITLYEAKDVQIDNNSLAGNRIALTIQKTTGVQVLSNKFQMNQTALESIKSDTSNKATENIFVGNLVNVRSDFLGMTLEKNYYDDYSGIDVNDDGIGDESYIGLQSFGQWMVRKPVYQYYVEAPSVVLLNIIDKVTNKTEQNFLIDQTPLTDFHTKEHNEFSINYWQLTAGFILLIGCVIVWRRSALK